MDADKLLEFLNKNYPSLIQSDLSTWAIDALIETDEQAGSYCADWEKEQELSDQLAAALNGIVTKWEPLSGTETHDEAMKALASWKEARKS